MNEIRSAVTAYVAEMRQEITSRSLEDRNLDALNHASNTGKIDALSTAADRLEAILSGTGGNVS